MKLVNWQIDGFGIFCGAKLPDPGLSAGFNLFIGPNEAGKSTLLDFIRFTLLGYPSRSSNRREPLRGGAHGGAIIYTTDDRTIIIQRHQVKNKFVPVITDADGSPVSAEAHERHTGHVNSEMFQNVFAFSLRELQTTDSLKGNLIEDITFAASLGQKAESVKDVAARLEARADKLLREKGSAGMANKALADLDGLEAALASAREASQSVADIVLKRDTMEHDRVIAAGELERASSDLQKFENLIRGKSACVERHNARTELNELGDVSRFPAGGHEQWSDLKAARTTAANRLDDAEQALRKLDADLETIPQSFPLAGLFAEATRMYEAGARLDVERKHQDEFKIKVDSLERDWERLSRELGANWPADVVMSMQMDLVNEDLARSLIRKVAEATAAAERVAGDRARADESLASATKDHQSACAILDELKRGGPLMTDAEMKVGRSAAGAFRQAGVDRRNLAGEAQNAENHAEQMKHIMESRTPAVSAVPARARYILLGIAALVAAAAVFFLVEGRYPECAGSAAVAIALGILFFTLRPSADLSAQPVARGGQSASPAVKAAEAAARLKQHDDAWREKSLEAGLAWPPGEEELTAMTFRLDAEARRADRWRDAAGAVDDAAGKLAGARTKADAARQQADAAGQAVVGAVAQWREFLDRRRVDGNVEPDTALALFSKVEEARRALSQKNELESQINTYQQEADAHMSSISVLLDRAGMEFDGTPEDARATVSELKNAIDEERKLQEKRRELEKRRPGLLGERDTRAREYGAAESASRQFLDAAGAADEAEFLNLSDRARKAVECEHKIQKQDASLCGIFGQNGAPEELLQAWASGEWPDWEGECRRLEGDKRQKSQERDALLKSIQSADDLLNKELSSDEIAQMEMDADAKRADIRKTVREWAEVALARELLALTREKFDAENQSPALDEAGRLFEAVSSGRYKRIGKPLDSDELKVFASGVAQMGADELSRGTLEQMYLCVRLGYIWRYQQKQNAALPVLMDDIAVNFDPDRMAAAFKILDEFCRNGGQILFFTCHPDVRKIAPPAARVFHLSDGKFVA